MFPLWTSFFQNRLQSPTIIPTPRLHIRRHINRRRNLPLQLQLHLKQYWFQVFFWTRDAGICGFKYQISTFWLVTMLPPHSLTPSLNCGVFVLEAYHVASTARMLLHLFPRGTHNRLMADVWRERDGWLFRHGGEWMDNVLKYQIFGFLFLDFSKSLYLYLYLHLHPKYQFILFKRYWGPVGYYR